MNPSHAALSGSGCDLVREVNETAFRECIPLNASCEITLRCNIRCEHCYNFDRNAPVSVPPGADLSFEEWTRVLRELREAGTLFVSFTGGEALVHPRFFDFLDLAAGMHFAVQVLTNGTTLTPPVVERLASYPNIFSVGVSVYGAVPETHDAVTRVPGSLRRTLDGSARLREAGVYVTLKFIVMRRNSNEVPAMIESAERAGLPYLIDTAITGRYDGDRGSLDTRVGEDELRELYSGPLRSLLHVRSRDPEEEEWRCNCARGNCAITSTGDVYPCIAVPWKAGNVRERPFGEIWRSSEVFQRIRSLRLSDYPHCKPCEFKRWCRRSSGTVYVNSGDYTSIDPWVCREAEIVKEVVEGRG